MPLDPFWAKGLLDFMLGGAAAPTQPSARWIQFATQTPTSQSTFGAPVQSRLTFTAAAANSPTGSVTNLVSRTASFATAACTIVAWNMFDSSVAGSGQRLMWGTFSSNIGCASGDAPAFASGALKVTMQ